MIKTSGTNRRHRWLDSAVVGADTADELMMGLLTRGPPGPGSTRGAGHHLAYSRAAQLPPTGPSISSKSTVPLACCHAQTQVKANVRDARAVPRTGLRGSRERGAGTCPTGPARSSATLETMAAQVVVITGASGGIGRATARLFAKRGAKVALLARGTVGLEAAAKDVEAAGGTALVIPTDVADYEQVERAAARAEEVLGPIDVWINDAFTSVFAPFTQIEPDEYTRVTQVSYLGFVYGTRAALDRMLPRNRGTIVQVGSALAYRGIPLQTAYCGAKHAIQGFNEALRCELLHDKSGVRVTMVQMPAVNTPQFDWVLSRLPRQAQPVSPIYQPEVAARAVVYAADHPSRREYWVGASTAATLAANAIAPGLLDRNLARTGYKSQQTATPRRRTRPQTCGTPPTVATGMTSVRAATSMTGPISAAHRCGHPTTMACLPPPAPRL